MQQLKYFSFFQSVAAQSKATGRPTTSQIRLMSARSATNHRLIRALSVEPDAGFPLRDYIRRYLQTLSILV